MKFLIFPAILLIHIRAQEDYDKPAKFPDKTYVTILTANNFDNTT